MKLLASELLPAQEVIAGDCGVHQSTVSRARSGTLKRVTPKVRAIYDYALQRTGSVPEDIDVHAIAEDPRLATPARERIPDKKELERRSRAAVQGLMRYLSDGYDAGLVIDQLAVLRRAQKSRVHRSDDASAAGPPDRLIPG